MIGAVLATALVMSATAQDGYRHSQDNSADATASVSSGPVRMARVAFTAGAVSWRPSDSVDWSDASSNIPLKQGAEIWVTTGARAEIQFDDGSRLHLGSGAIASLQTLYSDSKGEFSEIKLNSGLASLTLTNKDSMYQVDTPLLSAKAYGPGRVRIGIGSDVEVAVRHGEAHVEGNQGAATLENGQYLDVLDENSAYEVRALPSPDSWDRFTDDRDYLYDHPSQYVPSNIGVVSGDLEEYGAWQPDPQYGHVWYPRVTNSSWRPYHDGHWVWVDPFGWTWVGDEPWGWAPYHYGTWVHNRFGWGWAPGPRHQYWSPAVVNFSVYNGAVAWVPLAPTEVLYPPVFSAGVSFGFFGLGFSIGGACCYFPGGPSYVVGRPWGNVYLNRTVGVFDPVRVGGVFGGRFVTNTHFMPAYGRFPYAITRTTTAGFLSHGRFQSGTGTDPAIFQRGHGMSVAAGHVPVFGPSSSIKPTASAFTPSRTFSSIRPTEAELRRPVFRAAVPSNIARTSSPIGKTMTPSSRQARVTHNGGGARQEAGGDRGGRFNSQGSTSPYRRYGNTNQRSAGGPGSQVGQQQQRSSGVSKYRRYDDTGGARTNGASQPQRYRFGTSGGTRSNPPTTGRQSGTQRHFPTNQNRGSNPIHSSNQGGPSRSHSGGQSGSGRTPPPQHGGGDRKRGG